MTLPLLQKQHRYVVTYQCDETGVIKTYSVWAALASVATARTIMYIENKRHHRSSEGYALIPRISKLKCDYDVTL